MWQFLRLDGGEITIDPTPLYFDNLGGILAMFRAIFAEARNEARPG